MKPSLSNFVDGFLNLIFKENCMICGCSKKSQILCKNCVKLVEILPAFAHKKIAGSSVYSATIYNGAIRDLIRMLKFHHKPKIAQTLAGFLTEYYIKIKESDKELQKTLENAVVIPVPTHKNNTKERGYNNVNLIAKEFAKLNRLPFKDNTLLKTRFTKPQYSIPPGKRHKNVSDSFKVTFKDYNNETIILIDDIVTTGATLNEIIDKFHKSGIKKIVCLTVSKK